jgi:hypothetical protein
LRSAKRSTGKEKRTIWGLLGGKVMFCPSFYYGQKSLTSKPLSGNLHSKNNRPHNPLKLLIT